MSLLIAFVVDLVFGDPPNLPHPIRFIGKWISYLEKKLLRLEDSEENQKAKGVLLLLFTVGAVYGFYSLLLFGAKRINPWLFAGLEIFILYQMLATKCLAFEGLRIYKELKAGNIEEARKWIGYLVSRETSQMTEEDIIKATIETVTENIIDGVIAPIFFALIGGAPLGMAYKAANTLDSMVGYKNDRYTHFGWASARFDDLLNFVPARLTGGFVVLSALLLGMDYKRAAHVLIRDRNNHASPNSPYSEAPAAGALRIQLGGRATYFGVTYDKPTFGDPIEAIRPSHIKKAVDLLYGSATIGLLSLYGMKYCILLLK